MTKDDGGQGEKWRKQEFVEESKDETWFRLFRLLSGQCSGEKEEGYVIRATKQLG
jgi:hypothetical protein